MEKLFIKKDELISGNSYYCIISGRAVIYYAYLNESVGIQYFNEKTNLFENKGMIGNQQLINLKDVGKYEQLMYED